MQADDEVVTAEMVSPRRKDGPEEGIQNSGEKEPGQCAPGPGSAQESFRTRCSGD